MVLLTVTTDWLSVLIQVGQLLITGVGFWLLYTTFVLQAKIAIDQQKMLEIETRRARREVRPIFNITGTYDMNRIPGFYTFDFTCDLNDAYNLQIKSNSGKHVVAREPLTHIPFLKKGSSLFFSYQFNVDYYFDDLSTQEFLIRIELVFEDVDGFRYGQILEGEHNQLEPQRPFAIS